MAAPRKLPDDQQLLKLLREGKTYAEIVEWCHRNLGTYPTTGAVANWVTHNRDRYDLGYRRPRYADYIPWMVQGRHETNKAVRMLRIAARLEAGQTEGLDEKDLARFQSWREVLHEEDWVVGYDPSSEEGFFYYDREPGDLELIRPPKGEATQRRGELVPA